METSGSFLDAPVGELLDALATADPIPGGGAVAGIAVSMAAALCSMAARASSGWPESSGAAAQAEALRARSARLAEANAQVYGEALSAFHLPGSLKPEARDFTLGQALAQSVEIPLALAEAAADVAELAALLAREGQPAMRGDAVVASVLASAAARAAASLVAVNLAVTEDDHRLSFARRLVEAAAQAAARAERTIA